MTRQQLDAVKDGFEQRVNDVQQEMVRLGQTLIVQLNPAPLQQKIEEINTNLEQKIKANYEKLEKSAQENMKKTIAMLMALSAGGRRQPAGGAGR